MAHKTIKEQTIAKLDLDIDFTEDRIEHLEDSFRALELESGEKQREHMLQRRAILYDTLQILRNRRAYALVKSP
jgi:hypothetical protein